MQDGLIRVRPILLELAFWAVFIIGLADAVLSFLRVEGLHANVFGEDIAAIIALPAGRGMYFHLPLLLLAFLIALRDRSVSLISGWPFLS